MQEDEQIYHVVLLLVVRLLYSRESLTPLPSVPTFVLSIGSVITSVTLLLGANCRPHLPPAAFQNFVSVVTILIFNPPLASGISTLIVREETLLRGAR